MYKSDSCKAAAYFSVFSESLSHDEMLFDDDVVGRLDDVCFSPVLSSLSPFVASDVASAVDSPPSPVAAADVDVDSGLFTTRSVMFSPNMNSLDGALFVRILTVYNLAFQV